MPEGGHTWVNVYMEMLMAIAANYPGCPDIRTMRMGHIESMYSFLRPTLRKLTKPQPKGRR